MTEEKKESNPEKNNHRGIPKAPTLVQSVIEISPQAHSRLKILAHMSQMETHELVERWVNNLYDNTAMFIGRQVIQVPSLVADDSTFDFLGEEEDEEAL